MGRCVDDPRLPKLHRMAGKTAPHTTAPLQLGGHLKVGGVPAGQCTRTHATREGMGALGPGAHLVDGQAADVLEQGGGAAAGLAGPRGQQGGVQAPQNSLQGLGCIAQLPRPEHLGRVGAPRQRAAQLCGARQAGPLLLRPQQRWCLSRAEWRPCARLLACTPGAGSGQLCGRCNRTGVRQA